MQHYKWKTVKYRPHIHNANNLKAKNTSKNISPYLRAIIHYTASGMCYMYKQAHYTQLFTM